MPAKPASAPGARQTLSFGTRSPSATVNLFDDALGRPPCLPALGEAAAFSGNAGGSCGRKDVFEAADSAAERVCSICVPFGRDQSGAAFVIDPAAGALEIRSDLRSKVERPFGRDTYLFPLRRYLDFPRLYLRFFFVERRQV